MVKEELHLIMINWRTFGMQLRETAASQISFSMTFSTSPFSPLLRKQINSRNRLCRLRIKPIQQMSLKLWAALCKADNISRWTQASQRNTNRHLINDHRTKKIKRNQFLYLQVVNCLKFYKTPEWLKTPPPATRRIEVDC